MQRGESVERELGSLSRDVLSVLVETTDGNSGLPREQAIAAIEEANAAAPDRLWGTADPDTFEADVADVLEGLINRGYMYEVDDELWVTPEPASR